MKKMGVKVGFTEEEKNKIAQLYKGGMSLRKIGLKYNIAKSTVKNNIKHLVEFRPKSKIKLKEVQEEVIKMYSEGVSLYNIGRKLNLSDCTVKKFLKEKGLYEIDIESLKYKDMIVDILEKVYEGLPLSKIENELGVSKSTVSIYVNYLDKIPEGYYDKNRKYLLKKEFFIEDFYKNPFEIGFLVSRAVPVNRACILGVDFYCKNKNKEIFEEIKDKFTDKEIKNAVNYKGDYFMLDIISKEIYNLFKNIEEDKKYIQKFIDLGLGKEFFRGYIFANKTFLIKEDGTKRFSFSFRQNYIFDMFLDFIKANDINLYENLRGKTKIHKTTKSFILYKSNCNKLMDILSEN